MHWGSALWTVLKNALFNATQLEPTASDEFVMESALGAVCILGGFSELLRVGGHVAFETGKSSSARGVLLHYDETQATARVLLDPSKFSEAGTAEIVSVRLGNITPISESSVPLSHPQLLGGDILSDLVKLASSSLPVSWRAMQVLNQLLASPHSLVHIKNTQIFSDIAALVLTLLSKCNLSLTLSTQLAACTRLLSRLWNQRNGVNSQLVERNSAAATNAFDGGLSEKTADISFLYSIAQVVQSQAEATLNEGVELGADSVPIGDRMLKYWDKYIIPIIQAYVAGSFRPNEMEMFFAQLRYPLKMGNNADAISTALQLTDGNVPHGVVFPDSSKDFTTLLLEDAKVGTYYLVSPAAADFEALWIPEMRPFIGRIGIAKAISTVSELVLLQFYDSDKTELCEWWFAVECLKPASIRRHLSDLEGSFVSDSDSQSHMHSASGVVHQLSNSFFPTIPPLIARQAAFALCSSTPSGSADSKAASSSLTFLQSQFETRGAQITFDELVVPAVSEVLELWSLRIDGQGGLSPLGQQTQSSTNIGAPKPNFESRMLQLESNVASCFSSLPLEQATDIAFKTAQRLMMEAAAAAMSSPTLTFRVNNTPTSAAYVCKLGQQSSSAAALMILFGSDISIAPGAKLGLYADAALSLPLYSHTGKAEAAPPFLPLLVPRSHCFLRITKGEQGSPSRGAVKAISIHPSLGLSVWVLRFLLNYLNDSSSSSPDLCRRICFRSVKMIIESWLLVDAAPSPLKQALLGIIGWLLANARRYQAASSQLEFEALDNLKAFHPELEKLYALESKQYSNIVFTSYLQQLLDVLSLADSLRNIDQQVCSKFAFPSAEEEAERIRKEAAAAAEEAKKAASAEWECGTCTLLNPITEQTCGVCGTTKPSSTKAPKAQASRASGEPACLGTFHDMRALHRLTCYLQAKSSSPPIETLEPSDAVTLLMESAWKEVAAEKTESKLFIIKNLPVSTTSELQNKLAQAINKTADALGVAGIHQNPQDIYIGVDEEGQKILPPSTKATESSDKPNMVYRFKRSLDDNGIMHFLGTKAAAALKSAGVGSADWVSPGEFGTGEGGATPLVNVTASSSWDGMAPVLKQLCGVKNTSVKWHTKNSSNSWIQWEFPYHQVIPQRYTLRSPQMGNNSFLRDWKFEGSSDGKKWTILKTHREERKALAKSGLVFNWKLDSNNSSTGPYFNRFRLQMLGKNLNNTDMLALGGFELYGRLRLLPSKPLPTPTNVYAVVEFRNASQPQQTALAEALATLSWPIFLLPSSLEPRSLSNSSTPAPREEAKESEQKEDDVDPNFPALPTATVQHASALSHSAVTSASASASFDAASLTSSEDSATVSDDPAVTGAGSSEPRKLIKFEKRKRISSPIVAEEAPLKVSRIVNPSFVPFTSVLKSNMVNAALRARLIQNGATSPKVEAYLAELLSQPSYAEEASFSVSTLLRASPPEVSSPPAGSPLVSSAASPDADACIALVAKWRESLPASQAQPALSSQFVSVLHTIFLSYCDPQTGNVSQLDQLFITSKGLKEMLSVTDLCKVEGEGEITLETMVDSLDESVLAFDRWCSILLEWLPQAPPLPVFKWLGHFGFDFNLRRSHAAVFKDALSTMVAPYWKHPATINEFMAFIQQQAEQSGESSHLLLQPSQIIVPSGDAFSHFSLAYPTLASYMKDSQKDALRLEVAALRLRFAFLRRFNTLVASLLPLTTLSADGGNEWRQLGALRSCRQQIFTSVKLDFMQRILDYTAEDCRPPSVTLERMALTQKKQAGLQLNFTTDSHFAAAFRQLRLLEPSTLRPRRPPGTEPHMCFEVIFRGEHVVGAGGPYRQFFTDIGKELQDPISNCPLLVPSANNRSNVGNNRDGFVLNPSATSALHLEMFEFLGVLFGCAIRTGVKFPLNFTSFTWKLMVIYRFTFSNYRINLTHAFHIQLLLHHNSNHL
jgi:hypothetical protein